MFHWFDNKKERKEVALVLSTGGARGLAHIGAIDELLDHDYHIHSVAGTSMGALIGGMYAAGKLDDFREWMLTIDRKKIIKLLSSLKVAKAKNTIETELKKIERCQLLILDDAFLVPLDAKERPILLEIIEDRHDRKSIVIASLAPCGKLV